ncbi:unnamed protein product [Parnassius apollo]|uniref:(apollo) hypothetical protein n=1 Tax=Parnassius apollo TaxID=110799 RepID=A0A8S3W037_PARAO|nr:unnamed protein product [Parnassius apollo]
MSLCDWMSEVSQVSRHLSGQNIILTENQINQLVNYGAPQTNDVLINVSTFIRIKKQIYKHNILKLLIYL